jgi:hypothetical protein
MPDGFPFARVGFALSDACDGVCTGALPAETPIQLTQPEPGKLCLSGTSPGFEASLVLGFTLLSEPVDGSRQVLAAFQATTLGITQVRFKIDNPPLSGVQLWYDTLITDSCEGESCLRFGYELEQPITALGANVVSFEDFTTPAGIEFDLDGLNDLGFSVGAGAFNFCISEVTFLDAEGAEVRPE